MLLSLEIGLPIRIHIVVVVLVPGGLGMKWRSKVFVAWMAHSAGLAKSPISARH